MTHADPAAHPPKHKWTRRLVVSLVVFVILLVISEPILARFVRSKLVSTVETRTNASLKVGSLLYLPPYGVRVSDAEFLVPEEDGALGDLKMVTVKRLDLKLAKLPLSPGPLVIERVTITSPNVHLIKTDQGLLGVNGLVKPKNKDKEATRKKLSEIFELRHLAITDGQITYEDRTQPNSLPVVWKDLNINTETRPTSAAVYSYDFQAHHGSISTLKSVGTFDIDNLVLDAKSLAVTATVDRGARESSVPSPVQKILARYEVQGKLSINGQGTLPLKQLADANYQFDIALDDAHGRYPTLDRPIDQLAARVRVTGRAKQAISTLLSLEAVSGPDVLHTDHAEISVDLAAKHWDLKRLDLRLDASAVGVRPFQIPSSAPVEQQKLRAGGKLELTATASGPLSASSPRAFLDQTKFELIAVANDFHSQPPGFDAPIRLVTGAPIVANQDVIRLSNLTGRYGYDQFQINTLRIPLRDLPRIVRVEELAATATFDRHSAPYPGKIGKYLAEVRPEGPFDIGGTLTYDRDASPKINYHLLVHSESGSIDYARDDRRIRLTRIHADALVVPGAANLDYLQANVFGGVISATGSAKTEDSLEWRAKGDIKDFDLRTSVQDLTGKQFDTEKLAGRAFLTFDMSGSKTPESLKGSGEARLFNGKLYELPVLTSVLKAANLGNGLTGSEAAATFSLADAKIQLRRAAVGSPTIGVQGNGTIGFDQSLDLNIVIAPLGQWKDRLKQTGIPLVSKALGEVAGAVQGVVNAAASTLLYEFHVTGTRQDPKILPIPAPFLTKSGAAIFTAMLGGDKNTSLAEELKRHEAEEAAQPQPDAALKNP